MINKSLPIPIYYQLEEGIKELIKSEKLLPGEVISSEREFAEKYQISRMTVRQAINNLVNGGYLIRQRGKGTFVAKQKIEHSLKGLTSFSEDMKARGIKLETKVLNFNVMKATKQMAEKLHIHKGANVYELKRVRYADRIPIAYETMFLSCELIPSITRDALEGSIYEYIENDLRLKIKRGKQVIEASTASKEEADLLEIKEGAPVLFINRNSFLENNQPLEIVQSIYRADRYKFSVEMER